MDRWIELLREVRQMFRSRYVRELENEMSRLRAENRAMMNSLLGTVGVPPLQIPEARKESRSAMPAALHSRRLLERRFANPGAGPQAGPASKRKRRTFHFRRFAGGRGSRSGAFSKSKKRGASASTPHKWRKLA